MTAIDICLNALLVVGLLTSVGSARSYIVDVRVRREMGLTYSVATQLLTLTTLGLWVWLAVLTGFWQIGALIALGYVTRRSLDIAYREQVKAP